MPLSWKRPVSSEYPKVWHRFSAAGENFVIQDLPESMNEEAIHFMKVYYHVSEPLTVSYRLHENLFFLDYCDSLFRWMILKQKAALVCLKEGSDEIIGLNMNYVVNLSEDSYGIKDLWRSFYLIVQEIYHVCTDRRYTLASMLESHRNIKRYQNVVEVMRNGVMFNSEQILNGGGLCVSPKYRNRGIGAELLKTREQFCEEFNIKLTSNVFTSDAAGRCAAKAGFITEKELSYDTIRQNYPGLLPDNIGSNTISLRSMSLGKGA
ncbi:uncharacterized protein LOC119080511 [Bradysia coprophila]|uniref:uncharacterized protein LOC119080511 n=1 Tax=Bradysia coprophila TaxID=38358 RepID=UPI00187D8CFA|nr:uncharacterized protein LOC119080511 [Bradysia coprophila]XP_037044816.1 uncharacterized protein LOC119080511 [Bradysia coprophila]